MVAADAAQPGDHDLVPGPRPAQQLVERGREASLPQIFSITMLSGQSGRGQRVRWESGFCSRVETRAYPYRVTGGPAQRALTHESHNPRVYPLPDIE